MFCHSGDEIITQFVNFGLQAKDTDVKDVFFELNTNSDDKTDFEVKIWINNIFYNVGFTNRKISYDLCNQRKFYIFCK